MRGRDPHYRLLAACLSERLPAAKECVADPSWNWEKLVDVASSELVLPMVQELLQRVRLPASSPRDVSAALETVRELNAVRNAEILSQVKLVTGALNDRGIEPVALKGLAHLITGVYENKADRYLIDVDLLVSDSELPIAVKVLTDLGYEAEDPDPIELAVSHSYALLSRPASIPIDLHRSIGRRICNVILPPAEVIRDSTVCGFEGVRLRIPSPEHLLVHHIVHSQLHDSYRDRLWPPLRTLYDLVLLQRRFVGRINWAGVESRFRAHGQLGTLATYLLRAENVLGFKTPVTSRLSLLTRLRWLRRSVLWAVPSLRLVDPLWFWSAGFMWRVHNVREILHIPGGRRYLFRKLLTPGFFARLRADVS